VKRRIAKDPALKIVAEMLSKQLPETGIPRTPVATRSRDLEAEIHSLHSFSLPPVRLFSVFLSLCLSLFLSFSLQSIEDQTQPEDEIE
jgi:hypothetical protein